MRNQSDQDPLNFPIKTNNRLASLLRVVTARRRPPIGNIEPIFNDLQTELKAETDRLQKVLSDLSAGVQRAGAAAQSRADQRKIKRPIFASRSVEWKNLRAVVVAGV